MSEEGLMHEIIDGRLFGYVQCEVPKHLRDYFPNVSPIFKKTVVSRNDINDLMKNFAEKQGIMPKPRRMLISISSFILTSGTIITPLLLFFLKLGLVCKNIYRSVQKTPIKCFDHFVQSAVDARRQGDENSNSSVVAETMKLLADSSYGYQIMECSRYTVKKYLTDIKNP